MIIYISLRIVTCATMREISDWIELNKWKLKNKVPIVAGRRRNRERLDAELPTLSGGGVRSIGSIFTPVRKHFHYADTVSKPNPESGEHEDDSVH